MFDPTVFDNLKVIVEGYIYDLDLENEISVTDRSDNIDLATMSRLYTITFANKYKKNPTATIGMEMKQQQLVGELLHSIENPGCHINVALEAQLQTQDYDEFLLKKLKKIWEGQSIKLFLTKEITSNLKVYHHRYQVDFQICYGEDDIEDLLHIVEHSISLLDMMSKKLKS